MPNPQNKIGEAHVEVTADTSQLDQGIDSASQKVRELGDQAKVAGSKGVDAGTDAARVLREVHEELEAAEDDLRIMNALIDEIDRSTAQAGRTSSRAASSFRKFTGAVGRGAGRVNNFGSSLGSTTAKATGLVAVLAGVAAILPKISDHFRSGTDRATEFSEAIGFASDLQGATARYEALAEELARVNEELLRIESLSSSTLGARNITGQIGRLREDRDRITALVESSRLQIRLLRDAETERNQSAARKAAQDQIQGVVDLIDASSESLRISLLPEPARLRAEADAAIQAIVQAADDAGVLNTFDVEEAIRRYEEFIERKFAIDTRELKERQAREERADAERAQKLADNIARELDRKVRPVIESLNIQIGGDFGDIGRLVSALQENSTAMRQRR